MRLIGTGAAALFAFSGATSASAQEIPPRIVTVTDYLTICESERPIDQAACLHYTRGLISGIVGGQYLVQNKRGERAVSEVICPKGDDIQVRGLLISALKQPAIDRARPVYTYAARILSQAMPCPVPAAPAP